MKARLTFLHAMPHDSEPKACAGSAGDDAAGTRAAAIEVLAKAEAAARAWGVPSESMQSVSEDVAAAIVAAAHARGCDLILVASHGTQCGSGTPPSPELIRVLAHSRLPVLVAATGGLQPLAATIVVMRDEHRSLAAVLHAWNQALTAARESDVAPRPGLMRAMLEFIEGLEARHQPREEQLFALLRERTGVVAADLDELERQHQRQGQLMHELTRVVEALQANGSPLARRSLEKAVGDYARFTWDHVGREEAVVLPAARRYLSEADWAQLDRACSMVPDAAPDGAAEPGYGPRLARILDCAAGR
jgi:hemerythrin-like domain-containing protein